MVIVVVVRVVVVVETVDVVVLLADTCTWNSIGRNIIKRGCIMVKPLSR